MIEGNLKDVSLPGLLQFLASEASKSYRISLAVNGQTGDVYVCKGLVVCAAFGLLEGEDAVCEFLSWRDGTFFVEQLTAQVDVRKNLKRTVQPNAAFVESAQHLAESNVGLNTTVVASANFRSLEWQETTKLMPLEREDFIVVGWLGEGRTMRQALREFDFDVAQATSILCRLLKTNSVLAERIAAPETEVAAMHEPIDPALQRYITTGGQQAAAASIAQATAKALDLDASFVAGAFISTSFSTEPAPSVMEQQKTPKRTFLDPLKKLGDIARASVGARLRERTVRHIEGSSHQKSTSENGALAGGGSFGPVPEVESQPAPNSTAQAIQAAGTASGGTPAIAKSPPPQPHPEGAPRSPLDTSDMLSPIAPEKWRQNAKPLPPEAVHAFTSGSNFQVLQNNRTTASQLPAVPPPAPPAPAAPVPPEASLLPPEKSESRARAQELEPGEDSPSARVRTESLPLVTIDIDRLFQATFLPTQFGKLALKNPALDTFRRQTLMDVEAGKTVLASICEGGRPPAGVLNSYRYCLDRGYVETSDPIVPLTVDLLLGRMEIDQYLLQRRRLNGDQLRDLIELSRKEGVKLPQMLVRSGYLTSGDLATLEREQLRFALK